MTTEPKRRIYSVDVSDGFEVYETTCHGSFTENQIRAIDHIVRNAGKDPAPPVAPSDAPMSDADWVLFGRRMDGRPLQATDKGVLLLDASIHRIMELQDGKMLGMLAGVDCVRPVPTQALAERITKTGQEIVQAMEVQLRGEGIVVSGEATLLSPGGNVLGRVHHDGEPGQEVAIPLPGGRSIPVNLDAKTKRQVAVQQGFTGDICSSCHGSSMKRNGSCLSCADCGSTTGCS